MIQSFFQNDGSIRHPVWGSFEKWDMVFTPTKRLIPNNRKANTCKTAVVIYTKFKSYESYAPPPPSLTKLSPIALLMYFKSLLNILMYSSRKEFTTTELSSMWQSILYMIDDGLYLTSEYDLLQIFEKIFVGNVALITTFKKLSRN